MNPGQSVSLAALITVLLPFIGSTVSAILEQDKFPTLLNDALAWLVLVGCAIANGFATHQLTIGLLASSSIQTMASVVAGAVTLLISGPLHSLSPWLNWRDFLRVNLFNIAKGAPAPQFRPTLARSVVSGAYQPPKNGASATPTPPAEPDAGG